MKKTYPLVNLLAPFSGKSATAINCLGFLVTWGARSAMEVAKMEKLATILEILIGGVLGVGEK